MSNTPKEKEVYLAAEERIWDLPSDPEDFIAFWVRQTARFPADAKDPQIELTCEEDYGTDYIGLTLKYTKLESAWDVLSRLQHERDIETAEEQRDLEELKRLKAKYE